MSNQPGSSATASTAALAAAPVSGSSTGSSPEAASAIHCVVEPRSSIAGRTLRLRAGMAGVRWGAAIPDVHDSARPELTASMILKRPCCEAKLVHRKEVSQRGLTSWWRLAHMFPRRPDVTVKYPLLWGGYGNTLQHHTVRTEMLRGARGTTQSLHARPAQISLSQHDAAYSLYTLARCAPRSGGHAGRCRRSACAWSRSLVSVFRVYNCSHQSTRQPAPGTMRTRQLCSERALRKPETKDAAARQRSRLSRSRARGAAARSLPPEVGGCGLSLRSQERPPKRDSIITSRRAPPPRWFW